MAEGAGLLNQYTGNRIEGSNPSLSANFFFKSISYISSRRIAPALALAKTCEKVATRLSGPDGFGNCKGCQFTPDTLAIDKINHELL